MLLMQLQCYNAIVANESMFVLAILEKIKEKYTIKEKSSAKKKTGTILTIKKPFKMENCHMNCF